MHHIVTHTRARPQMLDYYIFRAKSSVSKLPVTDEGDFPA
jgi:hypothetical protein